MPTTPWSRYLETYHREHPGITERAFEHARDARLGSPHDWLVDAVPTEAGDVLDVACGNAVLQPRLSAAASYLGVDISQSELRAARARGRGPVIQADARALPLPDAAVDTVVSSMGLMLLHPLSAAVGEIARVLRPHGTAAFLLPAAWPVRPSDVRPLLALTFHLHGPGSMPQLVTRRHLTRLLREAGLTVVHADTHRFEFPLRDRHDAHLAVQSLYTPRRTPAQLAAAEQALTALAGPDRHLPVPLLRLTARKNH
ncbi:class I SAM-dependent methyltransferase [Georgenia sp. AZ-5]|uniref:class I SAM-dependent methyltransferase n=1 Tax=Georgenia sp. AZ-5 TaxID=3367526 RepID=UPI003754C369